MLVLWNEFGRRTIDRHMEAFTLRTGRRVRSLHATTVSA
jgi:hypothetical protein